jgi:hypothetical protein
VQPVHFVTKFFSASPDWRFLNTKNTIMEIFLNVRGRFDESAQAVTIFRGNIFVQVKRGIWTDRGRC